MRPFREIITLACMIGAFIANADDQVAAKAKGPADRTADAQLHPLQGRWEGAMVGDDSQGKVTITITGDLLHFHRDTNFWFKTTIALPKDTDPKQLHATIKVCPPPQADGVALEGQVPKRAQDFHGQLTSETCWSHPFKCRCLASDGLATTREWPLRGSGIWTITAMSTAS